ncbi:MAG: helix-turn-helix domain-containing protein [Patescibacteria group bacterium]|nr:helix-turn-helix domain-containing protein [Patescibacteria group bacterium]
MSEQTDSLLSLLKPYGLETDEARVYLELLESGVASALVLSRNLKIARTRVYRMLDKLEKIGLVTVRLYERGQKFEASNPKKLSMLVNQKEMEAERLKKNLPILEEQLLNVKGDRNQESKVLYYHGQKGLEQMTWNSVKAKGELLLYELESMAEFLDYGFAEKVREEFVRRKVSVREITNVKHLPAWTKVREFAKNYWQIRHIDKKKFNMQVEFLIYNDVYAFYSYKKGDVFGVEVHNKDLASMQRQMFDFIWKRSNKMKLIGDEGKAELA